MASNKSKTPGPIQVVVVLMLTVLAFYFGNRFGQVFDFNTMEITDGALATVNSIVAAPAAISTASVPMLYAIGLAITVLIVWLYTFMYAGNYRYGEEAGSAKWGTLKEGVAFKDQSDPSNNLLFTKNYGLALKKPKFDLEHDRNLNVMVIGGSGSGKTRNYVKPNLMQLNASYFLTDPKGTSLPECGYLFRDNGYRIKVFNTIEFNKSMHYNPLKYVKTDADILSFVNCLISNTNGDKQSGGDPFWENSERLLYTALEKYNGKLPTMVNFIFDEFANIGTIPDIEQTIAVTRSRNIGISIILQSVAQLESRYDKKAKTIIDCCDTTLFLGGKSNSTNKEISEMIGKQTINQKTFGETRGQSGSSSKNIQIQGRDLIDAAEIGKMNRREAILLIAGTNPLKDLKYPVEQHPNYIYLDPGRNKPGQVKNRCLYDEPFNILEYMDEIRTKDDTYAS